MDGFSPSLTLFHSLWSDLVLKEVTLRELDFGVIRYPRAHDDYMSSDEISSLARKLSHLQSLTLSNASPSDPVFSVLPDYLSYLSLNPYPLPYLHPGHSDGAVPVEIMPDIALFQILTSRKFENLETLVISYSWTSRESETALLNALV
ncbi:hypothetical protein EDD85DRAFT_952148 [Armillaria nabsnona]|nr:hypothetical protein EDD85DRAFT_952148 [Armillaria nabsnona]